jgi:hypothetical protein
MTDGDWLIVECAINVTAVNMTCLPGTFFEAMLIA